MSSYQLRSLSPIWPTMVLLFSFSIYRGASCNRIECSAVEISDKIREIDGLLALVKLLYAKDQDVRLAAAKALSVLSNNSTLQFVVLLAVLYAYIGMQMQVRIKHS